MKPALLICAAAFCWSVNAGAQGVLLKAGDAVSFGFNGVGACRSLEPWVPGGLVYVDFGSDNLAAGETLRLEMFENSLDEVPIAVQTYSPTTAVTFVGLSSAGSWLDYQGLVRVSMVGGSVDVLRGDFFVSPNGFTFCEAVVSVPEPSVVALAAFVGAVGIATTIYRKLAKNAARS